MNLRRIQGHYIKSQLTTQFNEMQYQELERNTMTFVPSSKKRQYAIDPVRITNLQFLPAVPDNILKIEANAVNKGKTYDIVMEFSDVIYENENSQTNVSVQGPDKKYNFQPIHMNRGNVKVRCNCLDFYHRFALWDFSHQALYGEKPPAYHRKTTTRPPVNPNKTPGVCKHLLKCAKMLIGLRVLSL